jgi:zinc-ribbon domain
LSTKETEVICPKCGAEVTGGADICASCGEPIPPPSSHSAGDGAGEARIAIPRVIYAGFWRRAGVYIIDSLLLGIVMGFLVLRPLLDRAGIPVDNPWVLMTGDSRQILAINLLLTMAGWLY